MPRSLKAALPVLFVAVLPASPGRSAEKKAPPAGPAAPKTEKERLSYAVGARIGKSLKVEGLHLNLDMLLRALTDVLNDRSLAMTDAELAKSFADFQRRVAELDKQQREKQAAENLAEGKAWLKENAGKEGVVELPSGLQYKVLAKGTGPKPTATDTVKANYRGTFISGEEFDSSYKRHEPVVFPVSRVIPGWQEALKLMPVGSKWRLFIPPDLAYGASGQSVIPPNSTLVFEVELLEIVQDKPE